MILLPAVYEQALCKERAPDDDRWEGQVRTEKARQALARELWNEICVDCPVRELCLEHAVDTGEHGIWAGTTERQRTRMRKDQSAPPPARGTGRSADVA